MTPDEAREAVAEQATVRLHYRDGSTRAVGRIISYSIVPTVTIELPDGSRQSWRHDMAEVDANEDQSAELAARALVTSPLLLPFVREFFEVEAHVIALRESVAAAETRVGELRAERAALAHPTTDPSP